MPALKIGYQKKVTSGSRHGWKGSKRSRHYSSSQGASSNMLRWPTFSGDKGSSFAPFTKTSWIHRAGGYKPKAMEAWGDALTRYVRKWNAGAVS